MKTGVVDVDGRKVAVQYDFVSDDTIFCIASGDRKFFTHYKSLVV